MARSTLLILLMVAIFGHDVCRSQEASSSSSGTAEPGVLKSNFYFNLSDSNFENFKQVLAPQFAKANVASNYKFDFTIDITPPADSGSEFVSRLQSVINELKNEYAPFASAAFRIAISKTGSGNLTHLKAEIHLTPPEVVTLPPSTLPEVQLPNKADHSSEDLDQLVASEILKQGYNADSDKTQDFTLNFNVLPWGGAIEENLKEIIIELLQKAVRRISVTGSVISISVNTQESNGIVLRLTVKAIVRIKPVFQLIFSQDVEEVLEIDLSKVANLIVTLQNIIDQRNKKDSMIAISIRVKATDAEVEEIIKYIQKNLKELDPSINIEKVTKESSKNYAKTIIVYVNLNGKSGEAGTTATAASTAISTATKSTTTTKAPTKATTRPTTTKRTTTTTSKPKPQKRVVHFHARVRVQIRVSKITPDRRNTSLSKRSRSAAKSSAEAGGMG